MKSRVKLLFLDFTSTSSSMGFPAPYFERDPDGRFFIEHFFDRVQKIDFVDKKMAAVHKKTDSRVLSFLSAAGDVEILTIDEGVPTFFEHHRMIWKARKWCHQSLRGGAKESTLYDEWLPMDLLQQLVQQMDVQVLLLLHPEQPLFELEYARQIVKAAAVEHGEKSRMTNFPLLTRQTASGMAPLALTRLGVRELSKKNWSPRHAISPTNGLDGFWIIRDQVYHDTDADMARENFCLRSCRDANRLNKVLAGLKRLNRPVTLKNMIGLRKEFPEAFLEDTPREIDLDIVGLPTVERNDFPKLQDKSEMSLELLEKLLSEICAIDDALLTVGVHGDVLKYSNQSKLKTLLSANKPYGLQICWDAKTLLKQGVDYSWFELDLDFLNINLTALSLEDEQGLINFEPEVEKLMKASALYGDRSPIVHFEISRCRENWRLYEMIYGWSLKYHCNVNWLGRNDMAGQLPMPEETFFFPPKRYACEKLRFQMYVRNDGGVGLCKQDYRGIHDIGNIAARTIHELWNDPKGLELRIKQMRGEYDCTSLCGECKHWMHT